MPLYSRRDIDRGRFGVPDLFLPVTQDEPWKNRAGNSMFGSITANTMKNATENDNVYDFIKELERSDINVLNKQEKLIKQKSLMDILGSTMAAWENFSAPLPDRMAAPRFTGVEASLPTNMIEGQANRHMGNIISQGRGLFRATGNQSVMPAIGGSLVDFTNNYNTSLAGTLADFTNTQQSQANQTNNLNAEALSKANEYNAKIVAEDNLRRSQIGSAMVSQIAQSMVDRQSGLINIDNLRGQTSVMSKFAKDLANSGNWELFYKYFGPYAGINTSDVKIDTEAAAEKTYTK